LDTETLVRELRRVGNPAAVEGMSRFGIRGSKMLGVSVPNLRKLAARNGKDHGTALGLWATGIHDARLLATMIDEPAKVTEEQLEAWVKDFDSWDIVDQACGNLIDKTPFAINKALEWTKREGEYEKRTGFSLMATLAVHDKKSGDKTFLDFLPSIVRESNDERNFVKKAVNWSLRQIGKRNQDLNKAAIHTAEKIARLDSKSARWIATDALRELRSDPVQRKLGTARPKRSRRSSDSNRN
jgi:3-methyladenine DNA glycosylase AlkD